MLSLRLLLKTQRDRRIDMFCAGALAQCITVWVVLWALPFYGEMGWGVRWRSWAKGSSRCTVVTHCSCVCAGC